MSEFARQRCLSPDCGAEFGVTEILSACRQCGSLLDVDYDWNVVPVPASMRDFEQRWANRRSPIDHSGVWRFRELLPFASESQLVTIGEGQTPLQQNDTLAQYTDLNPGRLFLQYEGMNPSGSFKDNGMAAAATHAGIVGARTAACASTGNTSASLAAFAATTRAFRCVVFVGSGRIAMGKLSQALDFGAVTLQIAGDFDDALRRVREVCDQEQIYLCNSVNPFRLEGQKTIMYRVLEGLDWSIPDWIVVPGGNLGNCSAFGKAFLELKQLGLIDRIPRLAIINAAGANTLARLTRDEGLKWNSGRPDTGTVDQFYAEMTTEGRRASTVASAIEINRPVNLPKALRAIEVCDALVREVHDVDILDAKAQIAASGFGCEPASAASVAGTRLLRTEGAIGKDDRVVCILTGHQLKDPDATVRYHSGPEGGRTDAPHVFANQPIPVDNDTSAIVDVLRGCLS